MDVVWSQDKVDYMLIQFDSGRTMTQVAADMTRKYQQDVTRNAVIGKLNRLGLGRVEKPTPPPQKPKPPPLPRRRKITSASLQPYKAPPYRSPVKQPTRWKDEPPGIFRCTIDELNKERCHWPFGDGPFLYCGAAVTEKSYCYYHYQRSLRSRDVINDK